VRYTPSICFESVLPQTIRGQVVALRAQGQPTDVLVNLTNDGWFWGSSELDMHLTCGVFRAVECRKPLLIAANTGLSAWIDADGRIRRRGPRRAPGVLVADVQLDSRTSLYLRLGDWPAGLCLMCALGLAAAGVADRLAGRPCP
jgi:apolipoprotein N-acyltransferase